MENIIKDSFRKCDIPEIFIKKCEEIENTIEKQLHIKSFIYPVLRGNRRVRFEYEKENGAYLAFEISKYITNYTIEYGFNYSDNSKFKNDYIDGKCSDEKMIEIIKNFYAFNEEKFENFLKSIGGTKWTKL